MYKTKFFAGRSACTDLAAFLNEKSIAPQNIIKIMQQDGLVYLIYYVG
ncbi:MAG: hypothetical protein IKV55_03315 [Oscillospiraceae bacterium]|nr:hypothetical protein [Oscillospiraceae bacterium]